jgi:hypothetical protein
MLATPQTAKQIHVNNNQFNSSNIFTIANNDSYNFYNFGINGDKTVVLSNLLDTNQFLCVGIGTNIGASTLSILDSLGGNICDIYDNQVVQLLNSQGWNVAGITQSEIFSAFTSVGIGEPVFAGISSNVADFCSIGAGSYVTVRELNGDIYVDADPNVLSVLVTSVGSGLPIYNGITNNCVTFDTISAGSYITINETSNDYMISTNGGSLVAINGDVQVIGTYPNYAISVGAGQVSTGSISITSGTANSASSANYCVALGYNAGNSAQNGFAVSVGYGAGQSSQGTRAVAIGTNAGNSAQGLDAVAIGTNAGNSAQSSYAISVGYGAGQSSQNVQAVAIGYQAGNNTQGGNSVAIGYQAGYSTQDGGSVAIGNAAGTDTQGGNSVAIGNLAGSTNQGNQSVAIGNFAGDRSQGGACVALGNHAAEDTQSDNCVAIGSFAGNTLQGSYSVAIGANAGETNMGSGAVGIGYNAKIVATNAVVVGYGAAATGIGGVALGTNASAQGLDSIAIGNYANATATNSICLGNSCVGASVPGSLNFGNNMQPVTTLGISQDSGLIPLYWNSIPYFVPAFTSVQTLKPKSILSYNLNVSHTYTDVAGSLTTGVNMVFNASPNILQGTADDFTYNVGDNTFTINNTCVYLATFAAEVEPNNASDDNASIWSYQRNSSFIVQNPFLKIFPANSPPFIINSTFMMTCIPGDVVAFFMQFILVSPPNYVNFINTGVDNNCLLLQKIR